METEAKERLCTTPHACSRGCCTGTSGVGQSQAEVVLNLQPPRDPPGVLPMRGIIWNTSCFLPSSPGRQRCVGKGQGAQAQHCDVCSSIDRPTVFTPCPALGNVQALESHRNLPSLYSSGRSVVPLQAPELSASLTPAPPLRTPVSTSGASAYQWCEQLFACKSLDGPRCYVSSDCH